MLLPHQCDLAKDHYTVLLILIRNSYVKNCTWGLKLLVTFGVRLLLPEAFTKSNIPFGRREGYPSIGSYNGKCRHPTPAARKLRLNLLRRLGRDVKSPLKAVSRSSLQHCRTGAAKPMLPSKEDSRIRDYSWFTQLLTVPISRKAGVGMISHVARNRRAQVIMKKCDEEPTREFLYQLAPLQRGVVCSKKSFRESSLRFGKDMTSKLIAKSYIHERLNHGC